MIIQGDSLDRLKELEDHSIDSIITDPPYGYSFMGKDWDKAVPSVDIWRECLRVLKPGGWCMVMSAPRSDVQNAMISRLMEAGFRLDFTPIYWTYASGFPKAGNVGKLVDRRLGVEREVLGVNPNKRPAQQDGYKASDAGTYKTNPETSYMITEATSPEAKALDGSYTGFQPKPAVEVVIVAMKPLGEKTYVDQALKNGKGITWLDDCRVPTADTNAGWNGLGKAEDRQVYGKYDGADGVNREVAGRFPANLLVSDDVLNDGRTEVSRKGKPRLSSTKNVTTEYGGGQHNSEYADSGSYSRYFDLDAWAKANNVNERMRDEAVSDEHIELGGPDNTRHGRPNRTATRLHRAEVEKGLPCNTLPFLAVPKASKSEKNAGTEKNHHPTVKPLKLMSYLITLTTREGDTVLDPFVGSGTTVVAAKQLGRKGIGIERELEYAEIAAARVDHVDKPVVLGQDEPKPEQIVEAIQPLKDVKPVQARLF